MTILATLVDLSRWQFALTAMYHWLFVPLTLGLGFLIAFMETRYVMTGDEFWKRTTKFWMKLFAINFAMGVATGIRATSLELRWPLRVFLHFSWRVLSLP